MEKTLGIDLGTNTMGLTLRTGNKFEWLGVYTFKKGVGEGKSGEFSLAAERTKHRSPRRLYNARRYRKWETLKVLIEEGFCPLTIEELNDWRYYKKGKGRAYPKHNEKFNNWIKLDFNNDGKPDYSSPYQLRKELIEKKLDLQNPENRFKVGRALYHIAQRRGFKSSKKTGDKEESSVYKGGENINTIPVNEYIDLIEQHGSLGAAFASLELQGIRIRNRYTLRKHYKQEVEKIIAVQELNDDFKEKILKAVFYQRPLRSQKGLIGKCTLEKNKYRCPVSHPKFEEFRAWGFLNNIKYKLHEDEDFQALSMEIKEKVYQKFFYKETKSFKFSEIKDFIRKNEFVNWIFNYKDNVSISANPVSAKFKTVFGDNWQNIQIKSKKDSKKNYDINDIWHILFSYDDKELFEEFLAENLGLDEMQIIKLKELFDNFPIGYGKLSLKAINNIIPFLQKGLMYFEAVLLAKIPEIIGKDLFSANEDFITEAIKDEIALVNKQKQIIYIVNSLISKHYLQQGNRRAKGLDDRIIEIAKNEVKKEILNYYGKKNWNKKEKEERAYIINEVENKYLKFLDGRQTDDEKASFTDNNNPETDYYKYPVLSDNIKKFLSDNFDIAEKQLNKLYHPSMINIYPKKEGQIKLESPKTAAFKNPMAYKTLYKLRDVINYLIDTGKIDSQTRIVVEIARELNDKNMRKAIEKYQAKRESENKSYAKAIEELINEPDFSGTAQPDNETDRKKFKLWTEQLENYNEIEKSIREIEKDKKLKAKEKDIKKYRLWKEQNAICFYTGKLIKITDLFKENIIDFEHTIPRSISFDNSLSNLTVCYAHYNRYIKNNKIPSQLENYDKNWNGYSAIKPRLKEWKKKVTDLEKQIDYYKFKIRTAKDKTQKDAYIQEKHQRNFEYKYWKEKVKRFEMEEVTTGFVRSQLTDTQLISKYAFHYLKTVFNRVDVQKGTVTAQFRKIYKIQEKNEKKNRHTHFHHAIDAAVLTLIPVPAKRDKILKKAFEYEEKYHKQYHEKPFEGFDNKMIKDLEKILLVNNMPDRDRALQETKRIVRKRGKIVWLKDKKGRYILDKKGKKKPKIAQGDTIRGQLHEESFYGIIRLPKRDIDGKIMRDPKGQIIFSDEYWVVKREPVRDLKIEQKKIKDVLVDHNLKEHIEKQLASGVDISNVVDFNNKKIRHVRVRKKAARGFLSYNSLHQLKPHLNQSKHKHKKYYFVKTGDNYAFALYVDKLKDYDKAKKKIKSVNLFEAAQIKRKLGKVTVSDLFEKNLNIGKKQFYRYHIFQPGQKVLFYTESKEELKDLDDLSGRLYYVKKLADAKQGLIQFQHHMEARDDKQLAKDYPKEKYGQKGKNGFSKFSEKEIYPRLLLSPGNLKCIIENKDFVMNLDGTIEFLF